MITLFSAQHALHEPQFEFYRGEKVACHEVPQRAEWVSQALVQAGYPIQKAHRDASAVIAQIHSARYVNFLKTAWQQWLALSAQNAQLQPFPSVWPVRTLRSDEEPNNFIAKLGLYSMDNGTPMVAGTWQAVKASADIAVSAAHLLSQGEHSVFCATRPPGHHAGSDFMGGYCFLNNAALAAQALLNQGCKKVAILDVDYHHGNGTQSIFYQRADVLYVSIHGDPRTEFPFYLGYADEQGEREGAGCNLNLPLPAGSSALNWFSALAQASQKIQAFGADALVVSLGLDTYEHDPISQFKLSSQDFTKLGQALKGLALPSVLILEGGYAAQALGQNVVNVLQGFEQ